MYPTEKIVKMNFTILNCRVCLARDLIVDEARNVTGSIKVSGRIQ